MAISPRDNYASLTAGKSLSRMSANTNPDHLPVRVLTDQELSAFRQQIVSAITLSTPPAEMNMFALETEGTTQSSPGV